MKLSGCPVLLARLEDAEQGSAVIEELAERYTVESLDSEGRQFRVVIDDARYTDEAVVRLASVLDEIDRSWSEAFAWPLYDGSG